MRDYWLTQLALGAVGWGYLVFVIGAIALAVWLPKGRMAKGLCVAIVLGLASILPIRAYQQSLQQQAVVDEHKQRYAKALVLFEERCKTAGEKIYKTVENVESIKLVNPRPEQIQGIDEADENWVGAGLPRESNGNQYIANFLFYDVPAEGNAIPSLSPGGTPGPYGSIAAGVAPKGSPGYRHVEVETDGVRIRYSLRPLSSYLAKSDPLEAYAISEAAKGKSPRYAVSYENIPDPLGRANWIAGARIKVLDQQSGELLGELVQYSFEAGFGSKAGFRQPWALARQCAPTDPTTRQIGAARYFAQKVLKPTRGQ